MTSAHDFSSHFEQLANEARLGKPGLKRRVRELARLTQSGLTSALPDDPDAAGIADFIRSRCARTVNVLGA